MITNYITKLHEIKFDMNKFRFHEVSIELIRRIEIKQFANYREISRANNNELHLKLQEQANNTNRSKLQGKLGHKTKQSPASVKLRRLLNNRRRLMTVDTRRRSVVEVLKLRNEMP